MRVQENIKNRKMMHHDDIAGHIIMNMMAAVADMNMIMSIITTTMIAVDMTMSTTITMTTMAVVADMNMDTVMDMDVIAVKMV